MSKTIYRLRLFVEETSQYFPIHLYALKDKQPTFKELLNKIESIDKNRNLNDYRIAINDTDTILCDNESLRNALKSLATNQSNLEIVLYHKSNNNNRHLHKDDLNLQRSSATTMQKISTVPVIKPAVIRWTPAILPTNIANNNSGNNHSFRICHVRRTSQGDKSTTDCRKDSGISMDEPLRKKQRIMSADHPRKLPNPSLRNGHLPHFDPTTTTLLHPLEIRRPSTAPLPSPPPISPFRGGPTLPAISSITSTMTLLDPQLAPIQNNNKRSRSSVSSTQHSHNIQQQNAVFVCEHETNGKVCGQTFRRSYDLSRHQTIHLENRPFCYCEKCGRRFTRMDALRRHERVQGHASASKQRSMSTSALPLRKTTSV